MRVAIIRLSAFGDIVISASMLASLQTILQGCEIEWFIDERFSGILEDSPYITKLHALPFKKLLKSINGILSIHKYCKKCGQFDLVIDMQGLLKSALVGKCLNTKHFIGYSNRGARESFASLFYTHKVDIAYDANILERNYKILFDCLHEIPNFTHLAKTTNSLQQALTIRGRTFGVNNQNLATELLQYFNTPCEESKKTYKFIFVLEASIQEKMYPINQYAILAKLLNDLLESCHFYILWNDHEQLADNFFTLLEQQNLCTTKLPRLNFNELKFCLMKMDCIIGGDTGVTHLAWAMQRNCITLYGNTQESKGKNMRTTKLDRVLLGNPYVVSNNNSFEIASIKPQEILTIFQTTILPKLHDSTKDKI